MKKREFIKKASLAVLGTPFYGSVLADSVSKISSVKPEKLATSEDFWLNVRHDYKLKPDYINLENGYYNIIPTPTLEALKKNIDLVNYEGAHYMRTVQWENKDRRVAQVAKVIRANPQNVILTRNTTESLNMVIKGMSWQEGDEAVFAEQDYGAMKNMFHQVAKRFKTTNNVISIPNHPASDEEIVALYENAITSKTKLLMVCHMINITGHILPVKKICQMAHKKGVKVMVDGAHCVGHFEFDINDLECDYYGTSLHKWLAVPLGTGLLYVADGEIDALWPLFAEESLEDGNIKRLNHTGTIPVYHDLTIEAAVTYYNILGGERKEARLRYLQEYWTSKVRNHENIIVNTPKDSHRACGIANVGIKGMTPRVMAKRLLDEHKVFTVAIDNANVQGCRVTPNVFTTTNELDVFVRALNDLAQ
jgi:selenocysteine lyase/cysteine desulfurase